MFTVMKDSFFKSINVCYSCVNVDFLHLLNKENLLLSFGLFTCDSKHYALPLDTTYREIT